MRKNILAILTFLFLFILSGCGSNSKPDGSTTPSPDDPVAVEMQKNYIVQDESGINFTLAIPITKKLDSSYRVELNGYGLTVDGCTMSTTPSYSPATLSLSGEYDSVEILYITGAFDQNCTIAGYTFTATQKVTKGSDVDIRPFSAAFDYDNPGGGGTTPPPVDGYAFYNATTPLEITQPNTAYTLKVQLLKDAFSVVGGAVQLKAFSSTYGDVTSYSIVTGADGYANFDYTSPLVLPANGSIQDPLEITFMDENNQTITQEIVLNFNSDSVDSTEYGLINVSNITIEHGSQKEDVKVQLTYNGIPIAGKTVNMLAFSEGNGTILNSYSVVTDSVGYATFLYMAPENLDDVNNTTLNLTVQFDEDTIHLEGHPTVNFAETTTNIEGNVSMPIVVIPANQREIILESNSKTVEIAIQVFKDIAPYAVGSVKVELPEKVLNGVDVGLFASYEVAVNGQGIANFSYTGPSNLQALISNDDNESTFKFYHVDNSENKQEMKVLYQLPPDPHISRNYELDIVTSGDFSMGIPDKEKTFNVLLKAKDSAGNDVVLSTENITKITVLTTNSTIAQILDTATTTLVNSLDLNTANNSPFILKSKELSGLVPVQVTVEFTDTNGDPESLTTIVNVRVFSGPASAISISYVSTGQDVERAKYIETLAISVTDEYGNQVNTRPNISLGAIVGYAVDGAEASANETHETKRLFYGRGDVENANANGEIIALGANTANFEDNTPARIDVFQYVNAEGNNTDKLVVFGEQKNYEAMGKWDITKLSNNTLSLQDDYYGVDRSGLYYAVGHNYYQDLCRDDGREWVGSTDSSTYQLDDEGTVTVTYKYDYHLTGKDALIWVNLDGLQPDTGATTRVGETVKHTLRGTGFTKEPTAGYSLEKGAAGFGTFIIWHENAPERYRNAHFTYAVKSGSTCQSTRVASSNHIYDNLGNSIANIDARTCDNGNSNDGTSYITFYLQAPIDKACTFDIDRIMVTSEF